MICLHAEGHKVRNVKQGQSYYCSQDKQNQGLLGWATKKQKSEERNTDKSKQEPDELVDYIETVGKYHWCVKWVYAVLYERRIIQEPELETDVARQRSV